MGTPGDAPGDGDGASLTSQNSARSSFLSAEFCDVSDAPSPSPGPHPPEQRTEERSRTKAYFTSKETTPASKWPRPRWLHCSLRALRLHRPIGLDSAARGQRQIQQENREPSAYEANRKPRTTKEWISR